MKKLCGLLLIFSIVSVLNVNAMERGENVAPQQPKSIRQQREEAAERRRQARAQERAQQQERGARRNLNPELEVHAPEHGEGAGQGGQYF